MGLHHRHSARTVKFHDAAACVGRNAAHGLQVMEVRPYVVHQTFQFGGTRGKRHRLREAMLWYDGDAYYSEGTFIHAELDYLPAPPDFDRASEFDMSEFHLRNMEHQLLQARPVFAVLRCARHHGLHGRSQPVTDGFPNNAMISSCLPCPPSYLCTDMLRTCTDMLLGLLPLTLAQAAGQAASCGSSGAQPHCGHATAALLLRPLLGASAALPHAWGSQDAVAIHMPAGPHL
jgi:hypothetical protein